MLDAVRGYLQLATGLTEASLARAVESVKALAAQGADRVGDNEPPFGRVATPSDVSRQVQTMAIELLSTSKENRDLVLGMVRTEVERAVVRLGFVPAEEVATLRRQLDQLDSRLGAAEATLTIAIKAPPAAPVTPTPAAAKKVAAKKSAAKKSVVPRASAAPVIKTQGRIVPKRSIAVRKGPSSGATTR